VDNHDRKRHGQIARVLAEGAAIIMMILENLDEIVLPLREGTGAMERIAADYMMVHRDILPVVAAPPEILALVRSILLDWVILNDLVELGLTAEFTPRRTDTMEELAGRLAASLAEAGELGLTQGG
jgi:hypothetical protein